MFYAVPGTYLLFLKPFPQLNFFHKVILLIIASIHYLIIWGATLAALLCVFGFKKQKIWYVLPCLMVIFNFFIFPIILRMPEARFMVPAFPFQLLYFVLFLNSVLWKR